MAQLEFDVWQFVRIMVWMEVHAAGGPHSPFGRWRDIWRPLDRDLEQLAARDHAAYAELMMDRQVTIDDVPPRQVEAAIRAADGVIRELDAEIAAGSGDRHHRESLAFEREEMATLRKRLAATRRSAKH